MKKNKELTMNQVLRRRKIDVRGSDLCTILIMYIGIFMIFSIMFSLGISNLITDGFTFKSVVANIGILIVFIVSVTYATVSSIRIKRNRDRFEVELSKFDFENNKYCFIIAENEEDIVIDHIKFSLRDIFPDVSIEVLPTLYGNEHYALFRIDNVVDVIEIHKEDNKARNKRI